MPEAEQTSAPASGVEWNSKWDDELLTSVSPVSSPIGYFVLSGNLYDEDGVAITANDESESGSDSEALTTEDDAGERGGGPSLY